MGRLIEDIKPAYLRGYGIVRRTDTGVLVKELYRRGVTVRDIFGMYYALEEQAAAHDEEIFGSDEAGLHGRQLTVGDAELAGFYGLPDKPVTRQPF